MADSEEAENRYAHLLVPIRDLQKNWDVDLSTLLESYLNELGNVNLDVLPQAVSKPSLSQATNSQQIRFMNFAEAALLIQGSTQVYSKKVEYLYALVFKLLELLSKKNVKNRQNPDGNDAENDALDKETEDDEPFLSLDDIQTNSKIDLDEHDETIVKEKAPKLITPMPLALVPLEDFEKSTVPLITKTGEVIGKKDDYRVNTCFLHVSGTLLLDLSNARLINAPDDEDGMIQRIIPVFSQQIFSQPDPLPHLDITNANDVSNVPCHFSPESAEGYPAGSSPTLPIETNVDIENDNAERLICPSSPVSGFDGNVSSKVPHAPRLRAKENLIPNTEDEIEKRKQILKEAWMELNEYDAESGPLSKPIRKGRTFKIPECLILKKKSRKRKISDDDLENVSLIETTRPVDCLPKDTLADFFENILNKRSKFPKNPLKVPLFGELDDLYWDEQKRRRLLRLKRSHSANGDQNVFTAVREKETNGIGYVVDENMDESGIERNLLKIFEGPDDEDDGGGDGEINEFVQPPEPINLKDEDFLPPQIFNSQAVDASHISTVSSSVNFETYEEYVRHNVEKYLQKAKQFVTITNLAKRVQEWEEKIHPHLLREEQRRSFDVHQYGDEILRLFTEKQCKEFFFRQFAATKPQWETCRYFLSSLMLANQGNVEVSQDGVMEQGLNTMKLKFLMADRHYTQLEDYLAPSVQERN